MKNFNIQNCISNNFGLSAAIVLLMALTPTARAAFTANVEAINNGTVRPAGVRTGTGNNTFFNVEGSGNAANASYGVADFDLSTYGIAGTYTSVDSITIKVTESNAAFTHAGSLAFFLSTDFGTSITAGSNPPIFDATDTAYGLGTQFATTYLIGTATIATTGNTGTGTVDTFTFTLSGAAQTYFQSQLDGGGLMRILVTPNSDSAVAGTFAGFSNATLSGPTLGLTYTAIPEPSTFALLVLGLAGTMILRRWSNQEKA